MKNLVEAIEPEVSRCYKQHSLAQLPLPSPDLPQADEWRQVLDADAVRKRRARQASKQERFEQAKDLFSHGVSVKEIAGQLGMSVRTVYRWLDREDCPAHQPEPKQQADRLERFEQAKALQLRGLSQKEIAGRLAIGVRTVQRWQARETCPYSQPRRKRRSIFDPYAAYVLSRWQEARTFCFTSVARNPESGLLWLHSDPLSRMSRALRQDCASLPAPAVADRVSVQKATWLIARPYEKLKAHERTDLAQLCQASQELAALYTLVQSFGQMLRKREGHRLQDWMKQVAKSRFRDLQRFAQGLQRDKEEVLAGLTFVYSNGQVEGQIHKLKLIKSKGMAELDFLCFVKGYAHAF